MGQSPRLEYQVSRSCRPDSPVSTFSGRNVCFDSVGRLKVERDPYEVRTAHSQSNHNENSTQSVESQSSRSSPKTGSPWDYTRYQHQPTFQSVRGGLSLSFVFSSWSVAEEEQPNQDQSNSRLPVRPVSPMIFYRKWIQQGKVLTNAPTNRLVRVELDDGDVRDQLPALSLIHI